MKDLFITFMEGKTAYEIAGSTFYNLWGKVLLSLDQKEDILLIKSIRDLDDMIYDIPFRICMACGCPMDEGFTDDIGETYFCSFEEFAQDMDLRYGKGNWRAEPTGKRDWCYEYREDIESEWLPEISFYTQWY